MTKTKFQNLYTSNENVQLQELKTQNCLWKRTETSKMISKLAACKDLKSPLVHSNITMQRSVKFVYTHAPWYFYACNLFFDLQFEFHNELPLRNERPKKFFQEQVRSN